MHVLDYILNRISGLFRFNNYPLVEKAYSVLRITSGTSLSSTLTLTMERPFSSLVWIIAGFREI